MATAVRSQLARLAEGARSPQGMAGFYFLYYAGAGAYAPFLVLYLRGQGLNGAAIGLLTAVTPLVGVVAQPLWGRHADRRGTPTALVRLLTALAAVVALALPLLHGAPLLAVGLAALAAFTTPLVGLADSITLRRLGANAGAYPRVRAWGSAGFAAVTVAAGAVYGGRALWRIFPALAVGLGLTVASLPRTEVPAADGAPARPRDPVEPRPWSALLGNGRYVAVVVTTFILQMAVAAHGTFFSLYLVRLHMPARFLGLPYALAAVVEVPMFALLPLITRRIGVRSVVQISLLAYALRYFLFSSLTVAWPVLVVQLMQTFTFTFFVGGMVVLAASLVPDGMKATGQTLFMGIGFSLAAIIGNIGGGIVVSALGVFWMYRLASLAALVAAVTFGAAMQPWRRAATE